MQTEEGKTTQERRGKRNRNVQGMGVDRTGWSGVPLFKGKSNILFLKLTGEIMSVVIPFIPLYTVNKGFIVPMTILLKFF